MAQALYKAGKIANPCADAGFFERLTLLERQFPSASVLVHKQGVLPPEIAALWSSPQLMSAARQFLGGGCGCCEGHHLTYLDLRSMPEPNAGWLSIWVLTMCRPSVESKSLATQAWLEAGCQS